MSIDLERFPWSDSANRMLTYVTKGWYDKSYVGKWIYEVMGRELDLATVHIEELPYQMFIDTATWGLKYHLDYMGLVFHGQNLIKRCYSGKTVTIRNVSTRIRASIFLKARRKIHRFAKKIKNKKIIGSKFAMSTIAYNGWFVTTDSFLVRVAECWDQLISMAKNIISRYAKQKSYAMEKYYKKWRKLNYA